MKKIFLFLTIGIIFWSIAFPVQAGVPGGFCNIDSDCPTGYVCPNFSCVLAPGRCATDADCTAPQVCNIPAGNSVGTCSSTPSSPPCYSNSDCTSPQVCLGCSNDGVTVTAGQCGADNGTGGCNATSSPRGACCKNSDNSCVANVTNSTCAPIGVYKGNGTTCTPNICGTSTGGTTGTSGTPLSLRNPLCANGATGNACVDTFEKLITKILEFITQVIGALAVLMLVVAGIFFVLAGAKPENVTRARQIALYAIIGLGIALAGNALVRVVTTVINAPTP